jgi:hypothetical protein
MTITIMDYSQKGKENGNTLKNRNDQGLSVNTAETEIDLKTEIILPL